MKKFLLLVFCFLLTQTLTFADNTPGQATNGRYVISQHGQFIKNTFIVDTQTGRVWQLVTDKENVRSWEQMDFYNINSDFKYERNARPNSK